MKALLRCLALVAALCVGWATNAQTLGDYTFSTGVDATKWVTVTNTNNLLAGASADGRASSLQNIGFVFPYANMYYTQFSVNTDGNLRLGSAVTGTGSYSTPFSSSNSNINHPKINFLGCDGYLIDTIHYVYAENTVDASNNNMLVVEFCLGTYNTTTRYQRYKWQVHLYGNGNIEVVMAPTAPNQAPNVANQKGLCVNPSDGWVIASDNTATHFTSGSSTTWASGDWPAPNTYYTFTRPYVSCPKPASIELTDIAATTASLTVVPFGNETSWVGTISPSIMGYSEMTINNPVVNLMMLSPSTEYTVSVRALCGDGDTSLATQKTFSTPCNPTTIPYTNNFDNETSSTTAATNVMPSCWLIGAGGDLNATQAPQVYYASANAHSGSYSMRLYYLTCVTLPLFQTPVEDLMLKFWVKQTAATYLLEVGVMTNPYDASTFVPVDTINNTSTTAYEYHEVFFNNYTGSGQYIAFRNITTSTSAYSYNYIDDLEVDLAPSCIIPLNVAVSNITNNSANVSWTSDAPSFTVSYGTDTNNMASITVNTNSVSLTNLLASSTYYVKVKAECSATDQSEFTSPVTFSTLCDVLPVPYSTDFDNFTTSISSTTGVMPNCWEIGPADVTMTSAQMPQIYYSSTNAHSGSYCLRLYYRGIVTLPHFNQPVNELMLKFWLKQSATSYQLAVGVMTDPSDASTFVPVDTINNTSTSYEYVEVLLNNYTGNGQYIAFRNITTASYSYSYNYIDDFEVVIAPSCFPPDNITTSNISLTNATLSWNGTASNYIVAYGTGNDPDAMTQVAVSGNSTILSDLSQGTGYNFYVKSICSADDTSNWSNPISFFTLMLPAPITSNISFFDGFEANSQWYLANNNNNKWFIGDATNNGGNNSLYISNDNGVSNAYTVSAVQWSYAYKPFVVNPGDHIVSFDWKANGENNYDYLRVFIAPYTTTFNPGVGPTNQTPYNFKNVTPEGWIALDGGAQLSQSSSWQTITDTINIDTINIFYLVFVWANDGSGGTQPPAAIDNVSIMRYNQFNCPTPTNTAISNVTENSAIFSWTGDSTYNNYIVTIETPSNMGYFHVSDTFVIINGLTPNTTYRIYVETFCDTGITSVPTASMYFTTLCSSINVAVNNPFYETFDNSSSTRNCWSTASVYGAPDWVIATQCDNSSDYNAFNGASYFLNGDGTFGYSTLISPVFNISDADSAALSFVYINPDWLGDQNVLSVLYRNNDTAAWDTLGIYNTSVSTWTPVRLLLPSLSSTLQIAFDVNDNYGYCVAIDSVVVEAYKDYCQPAPYSVDNSGITNVTFGYGSEIVNNSQRPTSSPYFGDYSDQIGAVPAGESAVLDITYATGYTYGTVIWVDWNNNRTFDGNEVVYVGECSSTNPTVLTASFDIPATQQTGYYRMRIAGADSYYDSYTGSIAAAANANPCPSSSYTIVHDYTLHVTAPLSCPKPSNITVANVTANAATISFTPAGSESQWLGTITPDVMGMSSMVLNDTVITLTGLTPNTNYTVSISALCGDGDTSNAKIASFSTPCASVAIPYFEDFDNLTGNLPDCWVKVGSGTVAKYNSSSYAHSGSYSLKFNGSTSNLVVLPPINSATNTLQMTLWMRPESYTSSSCGTFSVGYVTDVDDATSFVAVETYSYNSFSSIDMKTVNYTNAPANARLALRHNANSTAWYWFVDDIDVHAMPNCVAPSGVTASLLSSTSATVSWNANLSVSSYTLAYGTGNDPDSMYSINVSGNSTTVYGLAPETQYYFYVKAQCSASDVSDWSSPASLYTGYCLPNPTSVDNSGITLVSFGTGTEVVNNTQRPTSSPFYGNYYTMVGAAYAGQPVNLNLTYATGYTYGTIVWVDWNNNLTFDGNEVVYVGECTSTNPNVLNASFMIPATQDTGLFRMRIAGADSYFDSYTSSIEAAANANPCFSSSYAVVHDYTLHVLPPAACADPYNVTVDNVTANSAVVTWTADSNQNNFVVRYSSDAINFDSVTVSTNSAAITGLAPNTLYSVSVKAYCSATEQSNWSSPANFFTLCDVFNVTVDNPFYETFDLASPSINCWQTTGSKWNVNTSSTSGGFSAFDGLSAFANGTGSGEDMLISPFLNLSDVDSAALSFVYINPEWYGDQNVLNVLYRVNDTAAWDTLSVYDTNLTDWTPVRLLLPSLSSTLQIAFDFYDSYGYCVAIDSVVVEAYKEYCQPAPYSVDNSGITNVTFGYGSEIVNNSQRPTSSPYFGDYSDQIGAVPAGESAVLDITYATGYTYGTVIWVDWNNNRTFDGNEVVYVGECSSTNPTVLTASFDIPATQQTGYYRMRIAGADSYYDSYTGSIAAAANANPCPSSSYTIVHDYTLHVTAPLSCPKPSNITVANVTANAATISFTPAGSESQWLGTITPDVMGMSSMVLNDTVITLTGLTPNTNYTVSISALCGDGDTSNAKIASFSTPCASVAIPYFEDFDNLTGNLPDCWVKVGSGTVAKYNSSSYAHSGSYSLKFNGSTSNLVVLPPINSATNTLQMTLWMRPESYTSSSCGTFSVGYVTDVDDATSFVAVETYSYNSFSSIDMKTVNYTNAPANARLALRHNANSTAWYWFVDDIDVHAMPNCVAPSGVTASLLSSTSATVSWNANLSVSSYTLAYGTGNDPDSMYSINVSGNSTTVYGLAPETQYYFYVKAQCSASDVSDWSSPASLYTGYCLPNPTSVDNSGITLVSFGTGTEVVNNTQRPTSSPFYGNYYTMVGAAYAGQPVNLNLTYATGYTYGTIVWVDWNNNLTFDGNEVVYVGECTSTNPNVLNASFMIPATQDTGLFRMRIAGADSYFDSYTSSIEAAANANPCFSSSYAVVHDYTLHVLPPAACADPYNVTVDNVTANSAVVTWTADSNLNNFVVKYTSDSVNFDSVTVSTNSATITGLAPNTFYYVSVKAVCSATEQSNWSTTSFNTLCDVITITSANPFYETFELTSPTINCWQTNGTKWNLNTSSASGGYSAFNGLSAFANGTGSGEDMLFSPVLNLAGNNNATLSFVYINPQWAGDQNELTVLYRNDNDTAWNTLAQFNTSVTNWTNVTLTIPTVSSATQVAFHYTDNYGYCVAIDSVVISPVSTYDITLATSNPAMGTTNPAPGTYTYAPGDTLTITALPAANCHFVQWNDGNTNASRLITVNGNATFTATFDYDPITLTIINPDTALGSVTPAPGMYTFYVDDTISVQATANYGYSFHQWLINIGTLTDSNTSNPVTLVVPSYLAGATIFLTAEFTPNLYNIDVYANDNTLGTVTGSGQYAYNSYATISATPAAHCYFVQWNDGDTNAVRNVLVTGNASYTATFQAYPQYEVTLSAVPEIGGTVSGAGLYYAGDAVTISATPNEGYNFIGWGLEEGTDFDYVIFSHDPIYTFTMDAQNVAYVALFEEAPLPATVHVNFDSYVGSVFINNVESHDYEGFIGDTIILHAVANTGFHFDHWEGLSSDYDTLSETITFVITEATTEITCFFAENIGIDDVNSDNITIYSANNNIIVRGAEQQTVRVFDAVGRLVAQRTNAADTEIIAMPNTGIYLVQVGNNAARRVVVRR